MKKKDMKYSKAVKKLEDIMQKLESEELEIDELPNLVHEASWLIKLCKSKINKAEIEVKTILEDIDKPFSSSKKRKKKSETKVDVEQEDEALPI